MKTPLGVWKCPSCGYTGPGPTNKITVKVELSRQEREFKSAQSKASRGDPESMKIIIDLLDSCNSNLRYQIWEFLLHYTRYSMDLIIDSLNSRSNAKKSALIGVLAYFQDKKAVEPLISLLNKSSIEIKEQAIQALGIIGDKKAVLPLIQQLKNSNFETKKYAVEALLRIDHKQAIIPIINELENSSDEFCNEIFQVFQEKPSKLHQICYNNNEVVSKLWKLLLRLLKSDKPSIVSDANALLLKIIPYSSISLYKIIDSIPQITKQEIIKILGNCEDEIAINCLLIQLKIPNYDIQKACLQSLVNNKMTGSFIIKYYQGKNFEYLDLLINQFISSEDKEISKDLTILLIKLREISALSLIDRIDTSTADQKGKIIHLLSKMELEHLPATNLFQHLSVCSDEVKLVIIPALGKRYNNTAVNYLINLLTLTENQRVRIACSESLIKIKDLHSIPSLTRLQNHNREDVRKIAEATILGLGIPDINGKLIKDLTAERMKRKSEREKRKNDEENRRLAEKYRVKKEKSREYREKRREEIKKQLKKHIPLEHFILEKNDHLKIKEILVASKSRDKRHRRAAISALKNINSIDAINALKKISKYRDPTARNLAIKILRQKREL